MNKVAKPQLNKNNKKKETKMKSTKKALISAVLVVAICFTMLVGSTLAWFTDSASVGIQSITTGTLDLVIEDENGNDLEGSMINWVSHDTTKPQDEYWWEPGATYETSKFYIVNNGNLGFKFKIALDEFTGNTELLDVLTFDILADASQFTFNTGAVMVSTSGEFDLLEGVKVNTFFYGEYFFDEYTVAPGTKVGPLTVKAHMAESAGNEYMGMALENVGFTVLATQATGEEDSYNGTYDALATYPGKAFTVPEVNETVTTTANQDFEITTDDQTVKISGTAAGSEVSATVKEAQNSAIPSDTLVSIENAGKELVSYDIDVTGHDGDVDVQIYIGVNLGAVEVYHKGALMPATAYSYDSKTGYITITSSEFSPFEIAYIDTMAVTSIEQIRALLAAGDNVTLAGDVTNTDTIGSPYGKTGALVVNGGVLDGAGHEVYITGANNTWDCGIYTYGGTIKNLTVGGAFRGIFTGGLTSDLIIENVVVDKTCYTIHADGTDADKYMFIVKDSVLNGWTSYSNVYKYVEFTNCQFGKGTGGYTYAYCRPYNDTTFTNCTFSEDYSGFDSTKATSIFVNCYKGKTLITDANKVELLGSGAANIIINNK